MHGEISLGRGFPTLPAISLLHTEEGSGYIWIGAMVVRDGQPVEPFANPGRPTEEEYEKLYGRMVHFIEVLDIEAGRVLATARVEAGRLADGTALPLEWVPGTRESVRFVHDEDGFVKIELFEWMLVEG
jgi:hypothetical protein